MSKNFNEILKDPEILDRISAVTKNRTPELIASIKQLVATDPELEKCSPISVINCAIISATLDLPISRSLGLAFILPYKDETTGEMVAQFQIGYKGFKALAHRTNKFVTIHETDVRTGEMKNRNRLTGDITFDWIQDDKSRNLLDVVGYVSHIALINGFKSTLFMSSEDLEDHARQYSKEYKTDGSGGGQWKTNRPAMAMKTVIKLNLNRSAVLSIVDKSLIIKTAIDADQSEITGFDENGGAIYKYVDNDNDDFNFSKIKDSPAVKAKKAEDGMLKKLNDKKS